MTLQITVNSITATTEEGVVTVNVTIGDETFNYVLRPEDAFGLAPDIRQAIEGHDVLPVPKPPPAPIPDRVTANQFGKQLATMGLLDQVQTWVSQQDAATQWSFNRSATFVRDDPMMQSGFAALGFTTEQIDAFFIAASAL